MCVFITAGPITKLCAVLLDMRCVALSYRLERGGGNIIRLNNQEVTFVKQGPLESDFMFPPPQIKSNLCRGANQAFIVFIFITTSVSKSPQFACSNP